MSETFFEESTDQSQVKAAIVSKYFTAWARVIMPHAQQVAYLDLFAGPGRYHDGTKSTPILVLEQAIADPQLRQKLVTIFNDKDANNSQTLEKAINELPGVETLKYKPSVRNKEVGTEMVKLFQQMKLIPTLFFVDPWGYKALSLELVNAVVKDWACECIFFFNYNRVNMGLRNEFVEDHMNALFGKSRADALREKLGGMRPEDRELAIVEELGAALNPTGKRFVLPFRFRNERGSRTSHHLIFISKNFRGYHIMKGVMARESSTHQQGVATFEYSPADERFPLLFALARPLDDLENMLLDAYPNKTLSFKDLYETHSVGKRYTDSNYRQVLKRMEEAKKITAVKPDGKRRIKGTFPDGVLITFLPREQ